MKLNFLSTSVFIIALTFSKFEIQEIDVDFKTYEKKGSAIDSIAPSRYAYYDGSGPQNDPSNYPAFASMPIVLQPRCPGSNVLCWFRIDDFDHDGDIDVSDFSISFRVLDHNGNHTLDDESEILGQLEKKH